ncbi:MAG: 50S ribosomal protein L24 [Pseudomonadota bacterium]
MASKIKRGDNIVVVTGRDKGARGEVLEVYTHNNRVLVRGINLVKRHTRPSRDNAEGGIIAKEAPIAISNVALLDPKDDKPTRIGFKFDDGGKKVRYAKRPGEVIV